MTFVYLLSVYGEYGSEEVAATMSREKLPEMIKKNWPCFNPEGHIKALAERLTESDEELSIRRSGINLSGGWGGLQLHVVRLDA